MMDSDFPDLQDLDSLHLEDYQLMQERLNGKQDHFNNNNIFHHLVLGKPDLLIQDPIDSEIHDAFKLDLISGCEGNDLNFIPHLDTLESVLGSLHEAEVDIQESQLFPHSFNDSFIQQAFESNMISHGRSIQIPNGHFVNFSRSSSKSPTVTIKNQKRLSNFDFDDILLDKQDDTGKKIKWSDAESSTSTTNTTVEFKVASVPKKRSTIRRVPKKSSDGEMGGGSIGSNAGEKVPRHKRPSHINAEQRRRSKIQNCLDQLHEMVPAIVTDSSGQQNGPSKKSKASILYKTANCCRLLKSKTRELESETDALRAEIKTLCKQIEEYQSKLPETGATSALPSSSPTSARPSNMAVSSISMNQRFEDYVHISTLRNWKFWIFSLFIRPLFASFWGSIGPSNNASDFRRQTLLWLRDGCRLSMLRGTITNALLTTSSRTSAVSNASNLPVESIRESMRDAGIDLFKSSSRPDSR